MAGRADAGSVPPVLRVGQRTTTQPEGRVMPLMCRAGEEIPGGVGMGCSWGSTLRGGKGKVTGEVQELPPESHPESQARGHDTDPTDRLPHGKPIMDTNGRIARSYSGPNCPRRCSVRRLRAQLHTTAPRMARTTRATMTHTKAPNPDLLSPHRSEDQCRSPIPTESGECNRRASSSVHSYYCSLDCWAREQRATRMA
jgi:hypothetical protein